MDVRVIHDREGRIEAVVATNAPQGVTLMAAEKPDQLVAELQSHDLGGTDGAELISKLREIKNSNLSDLDTRPISPTESA